MGDMEDYTDKYDDADFEDDIDVEEIHPQEQHDDECEVLSESQVTAHMNEAIQDVSEFIELSPTVTRNLLNSLKWDRAKLCEQFYDRRAQVFREAGITDPALIIKSEVKSSRITCEICFSENDINDCFSANCGHYFCNVCWKSYLYCKILDEGLCNITCPQHNCFVVVEDKNVLALIHDLEVQLRFQKIILNAYVQCNVLMRNCPTADCGHVVQVEEPGMMSVQCVCECEFCFSCGEEWHSPIKCDLLLRWQKKNRDDSETSNWISVNTKDCPECKSTIQKDGGCNHMTCRRCKFEFCWMCLGKWTNHGSMWYNCNRFDEEDSLNNRSNNDLIRKALNRYIFYYSRYSGHYESLKFEKKLKCKVQEIMEILQRNNNRWIDVQFLSEAVNVLCNCRRTLMYTYVFSYYLDRNNEATIFEENQKDLHESTEILSGYLDQCKDDLPEDIRNRQQQIQDKFRYCEARRRVLIEHVKEGFEGDKWKFQDL